MHARCTAHPIAMLVSALLIAALPVGAQGADVQQAVIITIGSTTTHVGFAGDDAPRAAVPTIAGHPKSPGVMVGMGQKDVYYGDEAWGRRGVLNLVQLVQRGQVIASEEFLGFLHHVFYDELRVAPEEHPVLLAISDVVAEPQARQLLQMLFEEFNVPRAYIASQAQLAVYASGRTTALAIHMTEDGGNIVPVIDGYVMSAGVASLSGVCRLPKCIADAITRTGANLQRLLKTDADLRQLWGNILLTGPGSMTGGWADQLASELRSGAPKGTTVKVIAPSEREASDWIGGSILASVSTFAPMWITRRQFE
ncbi:MAG: hypothetical protein IIA27_06305 [Gemmatimonadetes bacterium]|nr:hypothetical protein [Gemmatimonadota bacterium]